MPFPKRQRRAAFYLALLFFLVLAPLVTFYSVGYNLDIRSGSVIRTGGVFVKTNHSDFKLFINNVLVKESGLISSGVLVTNLKPDLYSVRIEKTGFRPWQRFIHVEPESISEFRFVLLVPESLEEEEVLDLSRRGVTIGRITPLGGSPWVVIYPAERSSSVYLFHRDTKTLEAIRRFEDFRWDARTRRLLMRRSAPETFSLLTLTQNRAREVVISFPQESGVPKMVDFIPSNTDEFLVLSSDGVLSRFNNTTKEVASLLSDVHSFSVSDTKVLFVTKNGFFSSSDFSGDAIENYGRKGFFLAEQPARMEMNSNGDIFLIDSAGGFFVRRRGEPEVIPFSGNIIGAEFTPDGSKLLFWSENAIDAVWLADEADPPFRKSGFRERLLAVADRPLGEVRWFGPAGRHIIFFAGNLAAVMDTDNRGGGPAATVVLESVNGVFGYDAVIGQILRGSGSALFVSSFGKR